MKRGIKILALLLTVVVAISADTDTTGTTTTTTGDTSTSGTSQILGDHYRLFYEGTETAAKTFLAKMEACLTLYNSVLHFDLSKLTVKLKIRMFANKTGFDTYLKQVIKETKDDFVYIHYSDLGKCEMVGYLKTNETEMNTAILHQGFVQFLKAYVSNPPVWLQEGLAAYFEQAQLSSDKSKFSLPTEMVWLTSLKKIVKGESSESMIAFETFLTLDKTSAQSQLTVFYPQAWGLVYFLLNSTDRNINRILWDSIAAIDPSLSATENSSRVKDKAFSWYGVSALETAFKTYVTNLKTLSDLVAEAVSFYSNNDLDKSQTLFLQIKERSGDNYIPYYYLGLISYGKKNYSEAEAYYLQAKNLKAPAALISYAIGVNAYADNNFDKATLYLNEAKKQDPANYTDKVDVILDSIATETGTVVPTPSPSPSPSPAPSTSPSPTPSGTPTPTPS